MRVVSLHRDVLLLTSRVWATTCTVVRAPDGSESFVIDSPVFPDELEILPQVVEQAHFAVSGLLVTHGDWDHLLGRLAFPQTTVGAGEQTAARLATEVGAAQRALREFDDEHYVQGRRPLGLGAVQPLPVPGRLSVGESAELELHLANGHTADGVAFWLPWVSVLICGDYLSPVELPMISEGGNVAWYLETLERLSRLVEQAATVVPGHGAPLGSEQARRILAEDVAYIASLNSAGDAPLPEGRRTPHQKRIHAANLAAIA